MTSGDIQPLGAAAAPSAAAADAARLLRGARRAALATLDAASGHPYVSLITVALDDDAQPLMLLSQLARHTQNLNASPRASLLIEPAAVTPGDPLAAARVTLMGHARPTASATAKPRFLAHHPDAAMYAAFADFRFFSLDIGHAHFIGGFGRIIDISGAELRAAVILAGAV